MQQLKLFLAPLLITVTTCSTHCMSPTTFAIKQVDAKSTIKKRLVTCEDHPILPSLAVNLVHTHDDATRRKIITDFWKFKTCEGQDDAQVSELLRACLTFPSTAYKIFKKRPAFKCAEGKK